MDGSTASFADENNRRIASRSCESLTSTSSSTYRRQSAKLYGAPTLEVRICDCTSSRRLLAELAAFIAAFVHHRGTQELESHYTPGDYRDCLTNRWAAARYGLQATFHWNGRARPVVEVLGEMLDASREELRILGVNRSDLHLLRR